MSVKIKWLVLLALGWSGGWFSHQYLSSRDKEADGQSAGDDSMPRWSGGLERAPASMVVDDLPVAGDRIDTMLSERLYSEAVEYFSNAVSDTAAQQAKTKIVAYLKILLEREDYQDLEQLLSLYLQQHYRDVDALLIRARLQQARNNYRSSINTLYEALSWEHRPFAINSIRARIRSTVDALDTQLLQTGDNGKRLSLYEDLVLLEPDYSVWFLRLAKVQIELRDLDAARQSLILIESDPAVAGLVHGLLAEIEDTVTFEHQMPVSVPLVREGNHFVVEGRLNGTLPVRLLIDTGASMTLLKTEILSAAGLSSASASAVRVFTTANGRVQGSVYHVDSFSIGDQEARNMDIAGLDMPGMDAVDGLLGMNYLERFRFYIDQEQQQLRLSAPQ
jgi:clan AA aspartic protease (TIGR02281 family)